MDDALLRTEPSQLTVAGQTAPPRGHIAGYLIEFGADDQMRKRLYCREDEFVSATDREGEPVAIVFAVGVQNDISRRIVGVGVNGIRSGECSRCGRSHIVCGDSGYPHGRKVFGDRP